MAKVTLGNFDYDKIAEDHEKQIAENKKFKVSGEVKGGIVIDQLKRYAKKLSDHTGSSAMVEIVVWCHKYGDGEDFNVIFKGFECFRTKLISPRYITEDLRDIGAAIDDYINGNSK